MQDRYLSFGEFIRKKRVTDPRDLTLHDVADQLGVSASYVSAVENRNKHPFEGDMQVKLAKFLNLSEEDAALMYDIAGRETHEVPYDIEDIFFHEPFGDLVRKVIRYYRKGVIAEEDMISCVNMMEKKLLRANG